MFTRSKPKTKLDNEIDRLLDALRNMTVDTDPYARTLDQLVKLHKMKEEERPSRISKDTLAMVVANVAGIALIVSHEHAHVITSKALGFVLKPR